MSILRRFNSSATKAVRLSGACPMVLASDSVRTFHEASLTCAKVLRRLYLDLSGPEGPVGFTPGPSCVRDRDPDTRRVACVVFARFLAGIKDQQHYTLFFLYIYIFFFGGEGNIFLVGFTLHLQKILTYTDIPTLALKKKGGFCWDSK